jgi:hypothetical protein|tara:strand:- start:652 stop:1119 length:468 start_codon:yes stop_codon:yes gene_type:complete
MESCTECDRQPTPTTNVDDVCPVFNMSDGRHFTNYNSRCDQNDSLSKTGKVMNSYEYRIFLQKNAEQLMKKNADFALNDNMCKPCFGLNEPGTMLPEASKFDCNGLTCSLRAGDGNGIGTGRDYNVKSNNIVDGSALVNGNSGVLAEPYLNFKKK